MVRTVAGAMAGAVAVAVLAAGCSSGEPRGAPSTTTTTVEAPATTAAPPPVEAKAAPAGTLALARFSSCSSLLRHFKREALKIVTPYGLRGAYFAEGLAGAVNARRATADSGAGRDTAMGAAVGEAAAAPAGGAGKADGFSTTNIQEAGVDEPDVLKSDGRRLVTLTRGRLVVVDITGSAPRLLGSLAVPPETSPSELLLAGDRVVLLGHGWGRAVVGGDMAVSDVIGPTPATSTVTVVDIGDSSAPKVVATLRLDGQYVSARLAGGVVRLVVQSGVKGPDFSVPTGVRDEARLLAENRAAIRRSGVDDWLPTYTLDRPGQASVTAPLAPCSAVLRPKAPAGLGTVSVLTVDPADPKPGNPACVVGGGGIVYAGPQHLYVATERLPEEGKGVGLGATTTQLHRFAIPGRDPAVYVASGDVPGTVLNQFSLSELDGRLRIATTVRKSGGQTESIVQVLEARDGRLVTVGRLGNLGHQGETIHSVRFIGSRGYVVTFRQTDPLYVIDLEDPRNPRLRGELQIPGFSSYLHPLSESVLLGVGQGPGERGGQGLQLSLFDVRDPARPVRTDNRVFDNTWSDAQNDHHAFLWWAPANRLVVPVSEHKDDKPFLGAMVVDVDPGKGFGAVHRVGHAGHAAAGSDIPAPIHRAMVAGSRLLTLSELGVQVNDLATLAEQAWLGW
jgi:hypothetical protein